MGRGVVLVSAVDNLDFAIGKLGVVMAVGQDFSDTGGDGGVNASEISEDADFAGGVSTIGDESEVVGEVADIADEGLGRLAWSGGGFL